MIARTCMLSAVAALGTATLAFGTAAFAQQQPPPPAGTVEIFTCDYNNGRDMDDLMAAARRFNTWADQNAANDYTALTATPWAFSDQVDFDVGWIGAWPNGTAMGMGETKWLATGAQVQAAFDNVVECSSHTLYAAIPIRTPQAGEGPPPEDGALLFSNCTLINSSTAGEAIAAQRRWVEYMAERGDVGFDAILFPLAGETPDAEFTYKAVHAFPSVEQMGKSIDLYTTGGVQRRNQILGRVVDCDSPRVYLTHRVRQGQGPQ